MEEFNGEDVSMAVGLTRQVQDEEIFFALAYPFNNELSQKSPQLGVRIGDDIRFVLSEMAFYKLMSFLRVHGDELYSNEVTNEN